MTNRIIATRLTCFALLSAVEADLRSMVRYVSDKGGVASFLPEDVRKNSLRRWTEDHKASGEASQPGDSELLDYTDFADLGKLLHVLTDQFVEVRGDTVREIAETLIALAPARNRVCHSRPLEPDDFAALYDLAQAVDQKFKAYRANETTSALQRLQTNPSYVLSLVIPAFWTVDFSTVQHNLPLPEFDDTGFLGREKDRKEVARLLLSPHPVVTIVGEGGLGKTALALRCLYDLLEFDKCEKYDAIIWVSLKTRMLTSLGIEEIKDSITSTLGLVRNIATALGASAIQSDSVEALLQEIKDYMSHLKILLAIDNLETISPDLIRPLLSEVPTGSKVVITSRVGLGELELRYGLDPLDIRTAARLARRYGQTLNLRLISELRDDTLNRYCYWLHRNPLLIKWFVSSVAAGADPTKLLEKGGSSFESVVRFCFENLFERLSVPEKEILHILTSARRPLTQAELYFLTKEKRSTEVEWALNTLHHSSIVKRTFESSSIRPEDPAIAYFVSEFASEYIDKFAPPPSEVFSRVQDSLKQLRQMSEATALQRAAYKYEMYAAKAETRDQRICATYLRKALSKLRTKDFAGARTDIAEAKRLLPTYCESYRISGLIESEAGQLYAASREYETAEHLDTNSALVKFTFAMFLVRFLQDYDHALVVIEAALKLDPHDFALESVRALILMRLGRFKEAAELYEELITRAKDRSQKRRIELADQVAECYRRWAEWENRERDCEACDSHLGRALEVLSTAIQNKVFDDELIRRFHKILDNGLVYATTRSSTALAERLLHEMQKNEFHISASAVDPRHWEAFRSRYSDRIPPTLAARLGNVQAQRPGEALTSPGPIPATAPVERDGKQSNSRATKGGRILRLLFGFGFLEDDEGREWYFHRNSFSPPKGWDNLKRGQKVSFEIGGNQRGPCAVKVRLRK